MNTVWVKGSMSSSYSLESTQRRWLLLILMACVALNVLYDTVGKVQKHLHSEDISLMCSFYSTCGFVSSFVWLHSRVWFMLWSCIALKSNPILNNPRVRTEHPVSWCFKQHWVLVNLKEKKRNSINKWNAYHNWILQCRVPLCIYMLQWGWQMQLCCRREVQNLYMHRTSDLNKRVRLKTIVK